MELSDQEKIRQGSSADLHQEPQLQHISGNKNNELSLHAPIYENGTATGNELEQLCNKGQNIDSCLTLDYDLLRDCEMPPAPSRLVPKDRFGQLFGALKTQNYTDPGARGPGSHRYVFGLVAH